MIMKISKPDIINYGGDLLALITIIIAIVAIIEPYCPEEYAGILIIIALILTRASTIISKIISTLNQNPNVEPIVSDDETA